jgi:hypothetical protein
MVFCLVFGYSTLKFIIKLKHYNLTLKNLLAINTKLQTLEFNNQTYPVSTSKNGLGEELNSFKTPRGRFQIYAKIGENIAKWTIFQARVPINVWDGKITNDDLILSRILWLDGVESHNKNTKDRFIYIHGTNHENKIGMPTSKGCVRMLNADIIHIFNQVKVGDKVIIK